MTSDEGPWPRAARDVGDRVRDGGSGERGSLPVVEPAAFADERRTRTGTVRGVLLAAGTGSRFGAGQKLLEPLDSEPLVRHAAATLVESDLDGVTAVVGHRAAAVRDALGDLPVQVRVNDDYEAGQSTSVGVGVADAAGRDADAVVIALGDMPRVAVESVDRLIDAYECGVADAVAAAHGGRRGNPVLFDARLFEALTSIEGDRGGRALLLETDDAVAVETGDPGVRQDVDRPEDISAVDRSDEG